MEKVTLWLFLMLSILNLITNQDQVQCPKERCQSNGQCVDNISLCPVAINCPNGFYKTNQFTCSKDDKIVEASSCIKGKYTCWDNSCVDNQFMCPSMPTCPSSNNVRCSDNSCVQSIDDCPKYVSCPGFIPIRCPNGDCRKKLKDCPGLIQCPIEFSILCNDGSCRMTGDECEVPSLQTQCNDQYMTRCPDGTCTSSKFLCATPKTCPKGTVLCWNGSCASDFKSCDKPNLGQSNSCSNPSLVKCVLDGSCKPDISLCPTAVICPVDRAVRCWDFSCKESIEKCPTYQECPEGTTRCHDGTCTSTTCGTHITCSMDAPFKCYDNSCRRNPKDCPESPECPSKSPILCWDGKCVANRFDCLPPDACPITEPVKCPDNMCRKTLDECKVISDCPTGFIRCVDGTCRRKSSDCHEPSCPLNFPFKCKNGQCRVSRFHCDQENGCPFYKPIKCINGSCVEDQKMCFKENMDLKCRDSELIPCPDGSCVSSSSVCPKENGCPPDSPFRCANGICIDDNKEKCPIPTCPAESPIKCLSGLCVVSQSSCPSSYNFDFDECPKGLTACADGLCSTSPEECKPIFNCPAGNERCNDGSCRSSKDFCPLISTCPNMRPFRCQDGSCAFDEQSCLNFSGCPSSTPLKCSNIGLCVDEQVKCTQFEDSFPKSNGCDKNSPIKCPSGKCVTDLDQCEAKNDCQADKVYCLNTGTCAEKLRDCVKLGDECPKGYLRCLKDGKCKPSYLECLNSNDCPVKSPFRCVSGDCKKYPIANENDDSTLNESCDVGIQCPDYKPYLCADGSCAEKSSFCLSLTSCPKSTPFRCFDRTCAKSKEECDSRIKCPSKNPIHCSSTGNCVDNIFDCINTTCPQSAPYLCANGMCEKSPRRCVNNELISSSICKDEEATCYDGTCRKNIEECPIYLGCTDFKQPYKCPNGSCSSSLAECTYNLEEHKCSEGMILNQDGICRKYESDFGGCPKNKPLLCSTGICVNTLSECAGLSNCPIDSPFRCLDGSCVSIMSLCKRNKRDFLSTNIKIFVSSGKTLDTNIIVGDSNDVIGSLTIPSNTFFKIYNQTNVQSLSNFGNSTVNTSSNNTNKNNTILIEKPTEVVLHIKSVPSSRIKSVKTPYNATRQDDILKIFPYADSNNEMSLEYEYSVLSSVVEININQLKNIDKEHDSQIKLKNLMILMLAYDFPYKHESLQVSNLEEEDEVKQLSPQDDICLGKLNSINKTWECVNEIFTVKSGVNFELYGGIRESGIYSVILQPRPNIATIDVVPNFLAKYLLFILIISGVTTLIIFVGLYIFIRIYRYRGKYKASREENKKYEMRMQEMQMIGTTHLGQTLGDNLDNIIYTSNPAFRIVKQESRNQRLEELQNLQEAMLKRFRALEKNNDQLKSTYDNINRELGRLKDYKFNVMKTGGSVTSDD